jgi:RNA polymerase sigma-70 factor (ECF subfamily)
MSTSLESWSSATLLGKLGGQPLDQVAWNRFVDRYGPRIYGWCLAWRLQVEDARDVTQNVLLKLVTELQTFAYDPARSFRGWLKVVTRNAWADFLKRRKRAVLGSGDSQVLELLHSVEAGDDLVKRLGEAFDLELVEQARIRVQNQVEPESWEVFRLTEIEGQSSAEAAKVLGKTVPAVYTIRSRIRKKLRDELQKLEGADPEARSTNR